MLCGEIYLKAEKVLSVGRCEKSVAETMNMQRDLLWAHVSLASPSHNKIIFTE